jgi:hypothetical protein
MNSWKRLKQISRSGTLSKLGSTQLLSMLHMRVFDTSKGNTRRKETQRKLSLKKQVRKR